MTSLLHQSNRFERLDNLLYSKTVFYADIIIYGFERLDNLLYSKTTPDKPEDKPTFERLDNLLYSKTVISVVFIRYCLRDLIICYIPKPFSRQARYVDGLRDLIICYIPKLTFKNGKMHLV